MSLTTDTPELGSLVTGAVLGPGDPGYADAAAGYNLATEHRPDYVVRVADAQDVVATVGYARETGRRVAVQATGHGAATAGPGTVLVVIHADPVDPMPFVDRGILLDALPDAALDTFAEITSPAAGLPFVLSEIRLLGGALARPPAVPNAVAGRTAPYFLDSVGMLVPPIAEHVPGALATIVERMLPWSTGATTVNIAGGVDPEADERVRAGFGPETGARLDALRADVDPDGLLDPAARWTSPPQLPPQGV